MTKKIANRLQVNALLDPMLHERLDAYCKQKKVERSVALRTALNLMLDHEAKGGDLAEMKADIKKISEAMASAEELDWVKRNLANLGLGITGRAADKQAWSIPDIHTKLDNLAATLRGRGQ